MKLTESIACGGRRNGAGHRVRCVAEPEGVVVYDEESAPGERSEDLVEDGSVAAGDGAWGRYPSQPVEWE